MANNVILLDTSPELIIRRWNGGIKLEDPEKFNNKRNPFIKSDAFHTIRSIFQLPMQVYLTNIEGVIQNANQMTVEMCGYGSINEAIGSTVHSIAKREAADLCIEHTCQVITTSQMQMKDGHFIGLNDTVNFQEVIIKFPWYSNDNKIIGVIGFSINIGTPDHSLANALALIAKTGLLNDAHSIQTPGLQVDGIYLSKREMECLQLLLHGMTCKSIAKILKLSPRTVESYLEHIKTKMGVISNAELAEKYFEFSTLLPRKNIE